jgi:hypothetical protein
VTDVDRTDPQREQLLYELAARCFRLALRVAREARLGGFQVAQRSPCGLAIDLAADLPRG